jgi:ATP/maltotriose-dependent transcriptional regulator MalT
MSRALALVDSSGESRKFERASDPGGLLETKLYVPRPRVDLVSRPRLVDALRLGAAQKLTVVIAPAGFGKTTLLATWLGDSSDAKAWVSLDPSDNEPTLFWAYFVRALEKIHAGVGRRALALLQSPQPPAIESMLTVLLNEIDAVDADFTIVLDDYHVIDAAPIHGGLTFVLDHLPERMRLVIASRAEPPLPLARMRARGELTELRAANLRFTIDEASAFLTQVMHLDVSADDTATLERRTEGWIAGLKLAALSMKARGEALGFVDDFSGNNRYVADYLVEEVLKSEPDGIRRFLLATAILDRLSGPLCDAVTGSTGSQLLLEELERRNLFVVALDDRGEWYRYHHLFADVLQRQARAADPDAARLCHGRASVWYDQHGSPSVAVRHALAADDVERAAKLLEQSWPEKDRSYESAQWLARVKALPESVVRKRPVLSMGYAWGLLNSGELEAAEPWLASVEQQLETNAQVLVGDDERFRSLGAEVAAARVYLAQALGDTPGSVEHATRVLELVPEGDDAARATGLALLALARWGRGDLESGYRTFADALATMRKAGHDLDVVRGTFVLGDIRVSQGRLREALSIYESGLQLAREVAQSGLAETDELHLGLSEVYLEWNDLPSAMSQLETMDRSAAHNAYTGNRRRWYTAMARLREVQGDLDGALELLNQAEAHERRDPVPRVRPIQALKARIRLAQGDVEAAMEQVSATKLSVDDTLSYLREFEHVTLARILLARHGRRGEEHSANDALRLLERLSSAAEAGGRIGSLIEILVLVAVAQQTLGNLRPALDSLTRALGLAAPEGYLRVFLDEGTRLRELLRHAITRGLAGEYTRRVLASFDAPKPAAAPVAVPNNGGLLQPLTTRELEILRLIAAGLRNQEIADHLTISAATVKRHIANAYGKLGASHRTAALARAAELKLL